jgi:catechol 2,3-dioxygenase-like lactoylglutathione lyase family enzyme
MDDGILKIGNAVFTVSDMDRSVRFYEGLLGRPLKFRDGNRWAAFDVGGTTLALASADEVEGGPGATLSLKVADVDAWTGAAAGRGIDASSPRTGEHERMVTVVDPDGHRLIVYASLAGP